MLALVAVASFAREQSHSSGAVSSSQDDHMVYRGASASIECVTNLLIDATVTRAKGFSNVMMTGRR